MRSLILALTLSLLSFAVSAEELRPDAGPTRPSGPADGGSLFSALDPAVGNWRIVAVPGTALLPLSARYLKIDTDHLQIGHQIFRVTAVLAVKDSLLIKTEVAAPAAPPMRPGPQPSDGIWWFRFETGDRLCSAAKAARFEPDYCYERME